MSHGRSDSKSIFLVKRFEMARLSILILIAFCGSVYSHTYHLGACPVVEPMPGFDMNQVRNCLSFCFVLFLDQILNFQLLSNQCEIPFQIPRSIEFNTLILLHQYWSHINLLWRHYLYFSLLIICVVGLSPTVFLVGSYNVIYRAFVRSIYIPTCW